MKNIFKNANIVAISLSIAMLFGICGDTVFAVPPTPPKDFKDNPALARAHVNSVKQTYEPRLTANEHITYNWLKKEVDVEAFNVNQEHFWAYNSKHKQTEAEEIFSNNHRKTIEDVDKVFEKVPKTTADQLVYASLHLKDLNLDFGNHGLYKENSPALLDPARVQEFIGKNDFGINEKLQEIHYNGFLSGNLIGKDLPATDQQGILLKVFVPKGEKILYTEDTNLLLHQNAYLKFESYSNVLIKGKERLTINAKIINRNEYYDIFFEKIKELNESMFFLLNLPFNYEIVKAKDSFGFIDREIPNLITKLFSTWTTTDLKEFVEYLFSPGKDPVINTNNPYINLINHPSERFYHTGHIGYYSGHDASRTRSKLDIQVSNNGSFFKFEDFLFNANQVLSQAFLSLHGKVAKQQGGVLYINKINEALKEDYINQYPEKIPTIRELKFFFRDLFALTYSTNEAHQQQAMRIFPRSYEALLEEMQLLKDVIRTYPRTPYQ